jgi:hypothetical protein
VSTTYPASTTTRQPDLARSRSFLRSGYTRIHGWSCRRSHRHRPVASIGVAVGLLINSTIHAEPLASRAPEVAPKASAFETFIIEASQRFGIPSSWIRAVMQIESSGDVHTISRKGATGLMQIMPQTWTELRIRYGLSRNPYDPHDNIIGGAAYLRELHDRYGSPGFLAAYNAGPTRYKDHLTTGRPLPAETRAYVAVLTPQIGTEVTAGTLDSSSTAPPSSEASHPAAQAGNARRHLKHRSMRCAGHHRLAALCRIRPRSHPNRLE